jgi:hypothetical protein
MQYSRSTAEVGGAEVGVVSEPDHEFGNSIGYALKDDRALPVRLTRSIELSLVYISAAAESHFKFGRVTAKSPVIRGLKTVFPGLKSRRLND